MKSGMYSGRQQKSSSITKLKIIVLQNLLRSWLKHVTLMPFLSFTLNMWSPDICFGILSLRENIYMNMEAHSIHIQVVSTCRPVYFFHHLQCYRNADIISWAESVRLGSNETFLTWRTTPLTDVLTLRGRMEGKEYIASICFPRLALLEMKTRVGISPRGTSRMNCAVSSLKCLWAATFGH